MKILLLWPYGAFDGATLPICYLYLMPILKKHHHVKFLDCALNEIHPESEEFEKIVKEFEPDLVGISAWTVHKQISFLTLKKIKEINPKIITIAGGPHFTGSVDYSLKKNEGVIDFVLKGEAELTFPEFLEIISKANYDEGELKKVDGLCFIKSDATVHESPATFPPSLDDLGQPDYSYVNIHAYLEKGYFYRVHKKMHAPILTTRGCPYTCDYCASPFLNGRKVRKHSIPYLKKLIEGLYDNYGIRHFNIIDDNFTFDIFYAKLFCKMIVDNKDRFKGISFATPNGIRMEKTDQQLFYLMKAAGWERLMVAPESGSPKVLERMAKHLDLSIVKEKVKQIQKAGIEVEAFFILGHPGEDRGTVKETKEFIKDVKFDMAAFYAFQPLPGTPIFDQLVMSEAITYDHQMTSYNEVNWVPENWTKNEIEDIIFDLTKTVFDMYPWRFERLFAKHMPLGKVVQRLTNPNTRHKLVMSVYKFRKKLCDMKFELFNGKELQNQINQVILDETNQAEKRRRENRLKVYEEMIMDKSDELKKKAESENITRSPNPPIDLLLNDCTKIQTHKNLCLK